MNYLTFITRAKLAHGSLYDYRELTSASGRDKINIICEEHGEFSQRLDTHLRGSGCKKCSDKNRGASQFLTSKQFIIKAEKVHNNVYSYSKTNYINSKSRVVIICKFHGEFYQIPSLHLTGKGCSKCGLAKSIKSRTSTTKKFINKANEIHSDFYQYSKTIYINGSEKVTITCPKHGDFLQTPASHLNQKSGCIKCSYENAGWTKSNFIGRCSGNGTLYLLKLTGKDEIFYKVGITSNIVKRRYSSTRLCPYEYEIVVSYKNTPDIIWELEKTILNIFKDYKYLPILSFNGQTECFSIILPTEEVKSLIAVSIH